MVLRKAKSLDCRSTGGTVPYSNYEYRATGST